MVAEYTLPFGPELDGIRLSEGVMGILMISSSGSESSSNEISIQRGQMNKDSCFRSKELGNYNIVQRTCWQMYRGRKDTVGEYWWYEVMNILRSK